METTQIGTTVLFLYPNPNGRKLPSSIYANAGFEKCTTENINKNKIIAIVTLFIRISFFDNI